MKLYRIQVIFLSPETSDNPRIEVFCVNENRERSKFTDKNVCIEDLDIQEVLEKWLNRQPGFREEFISWFRDVRDTSVQNPFYPIYDLHLLNHIEEFLLTRHPEYEVFILSDEINVKVSLE